MADITQIGGSKSQERAHAVRPVNNAIETVEETRQSLAMVYVQAEGGSVVEHEVGECLTQVRKALVRMRKALGELAQETLPL